MNRIYRLNILILIFIIALVLPFSAFNVSENNSEQFTEQAGKIHKNSAAELVGSRKTSHSFNNISLFKRSNIDNSNSLNSFASNSSILNIDKAELKSINISKPEEINFRIPDSKGKVTEIELVKVKLLADDFKVKVIGKSGIRYEDYKGGIYYRGIVKGDNNSIVSLSVFENNVMGIISTDKGNFVLGSVKGANKQLTDEYVYYNDNDIVNKPGFVCGSGDSYIEFYKDPLSNLLPTGHMNATTSPVDIYFVCDYQMYLDGGSNTTNVVNFVTGAFTHVKTLYLNEQLVVNISSIDVYETADPYINMTSSVSILEEFGDRTQDNFTGDLAHLLSTGHGQQLGGIAWINVLCQSYEPTSHSGRFAFSNIEPNYQPYPVYSWTVMVITHETGHNFGSMHTHACVWPSLPGSGIGAIDSCYTAEGTCFSGTVPNNNGTIMSYCHLNGGINLTLGFGPLPGDTIRLRYNQALCLDTALNSSETPLVFNLLQNYPNPFNPSTNIKFALPLEGFVTLRVYDLTGRETAKLISNRHYPVGIFSYTLDASSYNLASGVYLYKLDVNSNDKSVYSEIKKMVLIK